MLGSWIPGGGEAGFPGTGFRGSPPVFRPLRATRDCARCTGSPAWRSLPVSWPNGSAGSSYPPSKAVEAFALMVGVDKRPGMLTVAVY